MCGRYLLNPVTCDYGTELADHIAAWKELTSVCGDMVGSISRKLQQNSEWQMELLDESKRPLFRIHIVAESLDQPPNGKPACMFRRLRLDDAEPENPSSAYDTVVCKACSRLHFINDRAANCPGSGKKDSSPAPGQCRFVDIV
jgi:hypothetical protein